MKKKIKQKDNVAISITFNLLDYNDTLSIFDYLIAKIEEKNYKFNCNVINLTKINGKFKELNLIDESDGTFFCLCLSDTEREREKELRLIVNLPKEQLPDYRGSFFQKEYMLLIFSKIREKVVYIDKENNQRWANFLNHFQKISLENRGRFEGELPKK